MRRSRTHAYSVEIEKATQTQSKNEFIQTQQFKLKLDIQPVLNKNKTEKDLNVRKPKNKPKKWNSLNTLTKKNFFINSFKSNDLHSSKNKMQPLSQKILSDFTIKQIPLIYNNYNYNEYFNENKKIINNNNYILPQSAYKEPKSSSSQPKIYRSLVSRNKSAVPKEKFHLESLSISNSPKMNLVKLKKHIDETFGMTYNIFKHRNENAKVDNTQITNNKVNNNKSPILIINGGNYFTRQCSPKSKHININFKNKKEIYLQYIERNLKQSRQLYIQNNLSGSRGNRQKKRKLYNPQLI